MLGATGRLAVLLALACACAAPQHDAEPARVPVLYCTDLFHPHDDPDDHFDLAALYALEELDVRGIVLDQGERQDRSPGRIPVEQMNHLTGLDVPWAVGLAAPLKAPDDRALDQPAACQGGVGLILRCLEAAREPVTIITVGSLRDTAAALNRRPDLFRRRVARLLVFIGEASAGTREWNVGLDPAAFVRVMNSGLPVWWVPCFDGGNFKNRGNASFFRASQADLLRLAPDRLLAYFAYALMKQSLPDHLSCLDGGVDEAERAEVLRGTRNLWCAPVFSVVAGREIVERGGEWLAVPRGRAPDGATPRPVFRFVPVALRATPDGRVVYDPPGPSSTVRRFQVVDRARYAAVMTSVTAHLLEEFPLVGGTR